MTFEKKAIQKRFKDDTVSYYYYSTDYFSRQFAECLSLLGGRVNLTLKKFRYHKLRQLYPGDVDGVPVHHPRRMDGGSLLGKICVYRVDDRI